MTPTPSPGVTNIFGPTIQPPGPVWNNPVEGISNVVIFGVRMIFIVGMILLLAYLLWGALDWVTSGGDEEKTGKARNKITQAIVGIIIMVAGLGIFLVVSGDVLGIIKRDPNGNWQFNLPTINSSNP